jgi:predicted DNA-binding transcriptional regulator AlpA
MTKSATRRAVLADWLERRQNHLISPRGLRADDAAAYLGMGKTKFLDLVDKGTIPRAFTIDRIKIWDRFDLDAVIDAAKEDTPTENTSFDKIMGRLNDPSPA